MKKKLTAVAASVAAALSLAACGGSGHPYPANVQANFLNACEAGASVAQCGCALHAIEGHVTLAAFKVGENEYEANGQFPSWMTAAATKCSSR